MVKDYIKGMSNCGAVITWSAANAAAKALINKYPGVIVDIDVNSSSQTQSLFAEWDSRDAGNLRKG